MNKKEIHNKFNAVYNKYLNMSIHTKDINDIIRFISFEFENSIIENKEINSGFSSIKGVSILYQGERAFFPLVSASEFSQLDKVKYELSDQFLSISCLVPPFIAMGGVRKLGHNIYKGEAGESEFLDFISKEYNIIKVSILLSEVYKKNHDMKEYFNIIKESVIAFYLGLNRASIVSLLPCVEGSLKNMIDRFKNDKKINILKPNMSDKDALIKIIEESQKSIINEVFNDYEWIPEEFKNINTHRIVNERIMLLESLKVYIGDILYENSDDFSNIYDHELNRHGILHGALTNFHNPINFYRLILILNNISLCSGFTGGGTSPISPGATLESEKLLNELIDYVKLGFTINKTHN